MKFDSKTDRTSSMEQERDETILTILQQQQKIVEKYVNKQNMDQVDNDANFEKDSRKNITDRDVAYTGLLNHYSCISKIRNYLKEFHKWIYFWIIMLLIIFFAIYVFGLLESIDITKTNAIENLAMIITSLISFSSVVISIPLIITKYLFSSEEDKQIAEIILHTQDHDLSGRQWAIDFKKNITSTDHAINQENNLNQSDEKRGCCKNR